MFTCWPLFGQIFDGQNLDCLFCSCSSSIRAVSARQSHNHTEKQTVIYCTTFIIHGLSQHVGIFHARPSDFWEQQTLGQEMQIRNMSAKIKLCAYYHSKFGTTILDARHVLSTLISVFILFTCFRICQISEFVDKMSNDVKWELVWICDRFVSSIFFWPQRSVLANLAPTYSNFNLNEKAKWQYFQQSLHFIFTPKHGGGLLQRAEGGVRGTEWISSLLIGSMVEHDVSTRQVEIRSQITLDFSCKSRRHVVG